LFAYFIIKLLQTTSLNRDDKRRTVVPVYGNEDLGKGLLREILRQINLIKEEYEEIRKKL